MNKDRLEKMLSLYRDCSTDEDLIEMIAELRDSFLDHDLVSRQTGYDIADVTPTGPDHVIYYIAKYISILEKQAERVQELEGFMNTADDSLVRSGKKIMKLTDEKAELEYQKKRYREAILIALSDIDDHDFLSVRTGLRQALEESE